MPVTLVTLRAEAADGAPHAVSVRLHLSDRLCYEGEIRPAMDGGTLQLDGAPAAWCGQRTQKPLSHSGDHVTIDWGYLYLAGPGAEAVGDGVQAVFPLTLGGEAARLVIAYDDMIACGSVNAAKEKGLLRSEGKEYVVQDGDMIYFRFNV